MDSVLWGYEFKPHRLDKNRTDCKSRVSRVRWKILPGEFHGEKTLQSRAVTFYI